MQTFKQIMPDLLPLPWPANLGGSSRGNWRGRLITGLLRCRGSRQSSKSQKTQVQSCQQQQKVPDWTHSDAGGINLRPSGCPSALALQIRWLKFYLLALLGFNYWIVIVSCHGNQPHQVYALQGMVCWSVRRQEKLLWRPGWFNGQAIGEENLQ